MGEPTRILSLGGGTQSCALALMSADGDLPRLDGVIFADTQGELPETYEYLAWLGSRLYDAGIRFQVVSAGSLEQALLSDEPTSKNPTPPAHLRRPDGKKGRIGAYRCSYDFKRRMIDQAVRKMCGGRGAWKRANVEQWIGFSEDEAGRCKQAEGCRCGHPRVSRPRGTREMLQVHTTTGCIRCGCERFDAWQVNRWPLIELGMRREDTIQWFTDHGYPVPPRSACWFCPNSSDARWAELRARGDGLWDRAVAIDVRIRNGGRFNQRSSQPFENQMYLHQSAVPLAEADLRSRAEKLADQVVVPLFDEDVLGGDCTAEVCFT